MATSITKGLIGKNDLSLYSGGANTFSRKTSTGGTQALNRFDWVGVDAYQVYGATYGRGDGSISAAIQNITGDCVLFVSPGNWAITNDLTIPSNICLKIPMGAVLSIATGKTLTVNGLINAGQYQIFSGEGSVAVDPPVEVYPEWWGAIGDGVTDDSTAIQAAVDCLGIAKGGVIKFGCKIYKCGNIEIKSYVTLSGTGVVCSPAYSGSTMNSYQTILQATVAGDVVGSPSTTITGVCIENISFHGLGSGTSVKGLYLDDSNRGTFRNLSFDNFADQAIRLDEGEANKFVDIFAQNCLLDTTRVAKIGVIDIGGTTDNFFDRCEATPSLSARSDANLYICAWAFNSATASNNFLINCVGEYSDIGFYIAGSVNVLTGCRGDLNFGHGFQLISGAGGNRFNGCFAYRNSQDNDNTYDGFNLADGAANNVFNGCDSSSLSSDAWQQRYGYHSALASGSARNHFAGCFGVLNQTGLFYAPDYLGDTFRMSGARQFTADDTTPSVSGGDVFWFPTYSGATDITDFDDGTPGQIIRVRDTAADGYITVKNNAAIATTTGGDVNLVQDKIYSFVNDNGVWRGF